MVDFTLIELHVDDAKLSADTGGSGGKLLGMLSGSKGSKSGKSSGSKSKSKNKKSSGSRSKKSSSGSKKSSSGGSKSEGQSGSSSKLPVLIGLVFLAAIAIVAKKRMGSDDSVPELESVEV